MEKTKTNIMKEYKSDLNKQQTERAIKLIKDTFQLLLSSSLNLQRVTAPMIVKSSDGINDCLNGEQPVTFELNDGTKCEIVHSLAKWKRMKLAELSDVNGIYTDMNAIRAREDVDDIHSIYVDQWDWEAKINDYDNLDDTGKELHLRNCVEKIWSCIKQTETVVCNAYPQLTPFLPEKIQIVTTQTLAQMFNDNNPISSKDNKEDIELPACNMWRAFFIQNIGSVLYKDKHGNIVQNYDRRAADYDNWELNGDIVVWNPFIEKIFELSSMGIRVDGEHLKQQLHNLEHDDWIEKYDYHKKIMNGELPVTIGGGIGQSRLCMLLLHKKHIGEVQSSIWPDHIVEECEKNGIELL